MSSTLVRIKTAVREGRFDFSNKARLEMQADALTQTDIVESIDNARTIYKSIKSNSPRRRSRVERLHIIISPNRGGLFIYTKGKLTRYGGTEIYYFFGSAKRSE